MKKFIIILVAFIAGVLMFNSCGGSSKKEQKPIFIEGVFSLDKPSLVESLLLTADKKDEAAYALEKMFAQGMAEMMDSYITFTKDGYATIVNKAKNEPTAVTYTATKDSVILYENATRVLALKYSKNEISCTEVEGGKSMTFRFIRQ